MFTNKRTYELPEEFFNSMGQITNKAIDSEFCTDEEIALVIDTPFEYDKELVRIYNEENGEEIKLPNTENVWVNTEYTITRTEDHFEASVCMNSAGDFFDDDEQVQEDIDNFELDDYVHLTDNETRMLIGVLEKSFSKRISEIFRDISKYGVVT